MLSSGLLCLAYLRTTLFDRIWDHAVSADTELLLQKIVWVIVGGHLITAALAAKLASQRGSSWLMPAVKVGEGGCPHTCCLAPPAFLWLTAEVYCNSR